VSDGIDPAIRFGQPRFSTLVSRKLIEAPILTVTFWKTRARQPAKNRTASKKAWRTVANAHKRVVTYVSPSPDLRSVAELQAAVSGYMLEIIA
jgi:hypothetical protein